MANEDFVSDALYNKIESGLYYEAIGIAENIKNQQFHLRQGHLLPHLLKSMNTHKLNQKDEYRIFLAWNPPSNDPKPPLPRHRPHDVFKLTLKLLENPSVREQFRNLPLKKARRLGPAYIIYRTEDFLADLDTVLYPDSTMNKLSVLNEQDWEMLVNACKEKNDNSLNRLKEQLAKATSPGIQRRLMRYLLEALIFGLNTILYTIINYLFYTALMMSIPLAIAATFLLITAILAIPGAILLAIPATAAGAAAFLSYPLAIAAGAAIVAMIPPLLPVFYKPLAVLYVCFGIFSSIKISLTKNSYRDTLYNDVMNELTNAKKSLENLEGEMEQYSDDSESDSSSYQSDDSSGKTPSPSKAGMFAKAQSPSRQQPANDKEEEFGCTYRIN